MSDAESLDVVIVGAGPAGCACAITLLRDNPSLRVRLLDAKPAKNQSGIYPYQIGESLPGAALRLLNRLGIDGIEKLLPNDQYKKCLGNSSSWGSDQWVNQDAIMNPEGGGWHLDRHGFDEALRQEAISLKVDFMQGAIQAVTPAGNPRWKLSCQSPTPGEGPSIHSTFHCDWLIDATGRKSVIGKKLNVERTRCDHQMAAYCWLHANDRDQDHTSRIKSVATGWWYSSKLPSQQRVLAFFGLPKSIAHYVRTPEEYVHHVNTAGLLNYEIESSDLCTELQATDASMCRLKTAVQEGWLAVGDAALSFDPLSSQGIFFALYSGIRAAEAINTELGENSDGIALQRYQDQLERIFSANRQSQQYHYNSEQRYLSEDYWRTRCRHQSLP